ncbi:hypothetical protein AAAU98_13880 [Enterocloster citroniae]|uniref:hypothetical protein n=1 Tax=Enterocloster citroniae TaxID=358743 RepID=UPI00189880EA|nr:hypothetical protein [Enterocloster citroniae]
MEERIDGKKLNMYMRGIDVIAAEADNMVYYYILDEHGDVSELRNQGGICKASYEYDAFGIERNPNKEDDNTIK